MNYSLLIIAVSSGMYFALAYNSHIENFNFPMGRAAVGMCRASGDQLADSENIYQPIFTSTVYYFCFANASYPGGYYIIPMTCPPESYFNVTFQVCLEFDIELTVASSSTTTDSAAASTTTDSSAASTTTENSSASTVSGGSSASTVSGGSSASTVSGGSSASTVSGGSSASTVSGGSSASTVSGNSSASTVSGVSSASTVSGGSSASTVSGGSTSSGEPSTTSGVSSATSSPTDSSQSTTASSGNTTECMETSTPSGGGMSNISCTSEGRFPYANCTQYYICIQVGTTWYNFVYSCPTGTYYNPKSKACATGTCSNPTTVAPTTPGCTTGAATTGQMNNSTTTAAPMTTSGPRYSCASMVEGLYPDPEDCHMYYQCAVSNGVWYYYIFTCPAGAYFDTVSKTCIPGTC